MLGTGKKMRRIYLSLLWNHIITIITIITIIVDKGPAQ
jgi:hypothetical protein